MADDRIKLGVLWKNVSREGNRTYLSGRVQQDGLDAAVDLLRDGGRFLVLGNTKRPDKQDPDYVLFVVPERERREERPVPERTPQSRQNSAPQPGRQPGNSGSRAPR